MRDDNRETVRAQRVRGTDRVREIKNGRADIVIPAAKCHGVSGDKRREIYHEGEDVVPRHGVRRRERPWVIPANHFAAAGNRGKRVAAFQDAGLESSRRADTLQ